MPKHRRRRTAPLRRRKPVVEPQRRLYLFCEGAKTEPAYFDAVRRQFDNAHHHERSPAPDFSGLLAMLEVAEERASDQAKRREQEGVPSGNPSTTVFRLLRAIRVAHEDARRPT